MTPKKYWERLLIVVVMFFVFIVITTTCLPLIIKYLHVQKDTREGMLILSVVQAVLMFIVPSLISAKIISYNAFGYLQLKRAPGWLPVLGVIFAYLISLPALNQLIYWNAHAVFPAGMEAWAQTLRTMEETAARSASMMLETTSAGAMLVNLLVVGLITAFAEEIFFRGTLQRTATYSRTSAYTSIWIVAFFFSAMHFQFFGFVPRLLLGAWFGYLLFWTRSLYVPIIAHFINNGVVVVCVWLNASGITAFDFENFGVVESGIPYPAIVSAAALTVFLVFFGSFFFRSRRMLAEENNEGQLDLA